MQEVREKMDKRIGKLLEKENKNYGIKEPSLNWTGGRVTKDEFFKYWLKVSIPSSLIRLVGLRGIFGQYKRINKRGRGKVPEAEYNKV